MPDKRPARSDFSPCFETLYYRTPMMMHSIDPSGCLLAVSDFWLESLGYERDEVIGRKLTDFFTKESKDLAEQTVLPRFFKVGLVREVPYQMIKKNGDVIDVLITAVAESDEEGQVVHSMAGIVDVTERKKAEEQVHRLAHYDTLTELPNRFLLQDRLQHALIQAQREQCRVGVLFLDLDRFKWVNDTLGHAAGDQLLQKVSQQLLRCVRKGDTVARLGGDEFVIVLYGFDSDDELPRFAQRFLDALAVPVQIDGTEIHNSASVGIAIYPLDGQDVETLLRNADMAMYAAKDLGRNNYQFFSADMNQRTMAKLGMESRLRRAIRQEEFFLEYQPQLDLTTGRIAGFEALLRWNDPDYGVLRPNAFISAAEESGLIFPIGEWVLATACRQARLWQERGLPPVRMAVNISGQQLRRHDFIDMVESKLAQSGLAAKHLEIELTETVVMEDIRKGMETLTDLKVRDINLAIDDFGTGYSSLVYLKHFPFDRIKIAQEFVRDIPEDTEDMAIVEAIFALARTLNLEVIAEGVERKAQLDYLCSCRCHEMQGYYFAPPMSAVDLDRYMSHGWPEKQACLFNG